MAVSNTQRVRNGLDTLKQGLIPYVEREFAAYADDWMDRVDSSVQVRKASDGTFDWDVSALVKAMSDFWRPVFSNTLGHDARSYLSLIRTIRNDWGHEKRFTSDEVLRALDQMEQLLRAVGASEQAEETSKQRKDLNRAVFAEEARNRTRYTPTFEGMASANLQPWRSVVTPHKDVASGNYMQAEFAADLAQVNKGEGVPEYSDPVEFFRRTYITEGMKDLLVGALTRLDGGDGDPVVELQTNFGGGKTHSMLALYHLFSGVDAGSLEGLEPLLNESGVTHPKRASRAVLVGTALSPSETSVKEDGTTVRTFWGEMAWQLGGANGYAKVADSDAAGVSPGAGVLAELFKAHAPCLVLIDEWVAYARQIPGKEGLPAGSFDAQASFAQALTEAAKQAPGTLVVASIPASKIEIGGENGEKALDVLKNVFQRVAKPWRPAGGDEGFEIVRRRLFEPIATKEDFATRDAVIEDFLNMYRKNEGDFPLDCREGDYREKMRGSYPIHPELFRRLYDDWSTLDRFQRTRGVLRLLAKVIHRLWESGDKALMIMPASIPMDDPTIKSELTRYLSDPWEPIISKDIDGADSMPLELDSRITNLGKLAAARRVARTLYIGTAPGSDSSTPGIGAERILLGAAQPGEPLGTFSDALRRISDRGQNIHQDGNRYWISTKPNLNRTAEAKASQLLREPEELHADLVAKLREDRSRGAFSGVHVCPESPAEVPDEAKTRLVIFGPKLTHKRRKEDTLAAQSAAEYLESRGSGPRVYQNAVVFLAPDEKELASLLEAAASYRAWNEIHERWETYNLDAFQKNQAKSKAAEFKQAVDIKIGQTWIWAISPTRLTPSEPIRWDFVKVSGSESLAERTASKLTKDEHLLPQMGGVRLRMELDKYLWEEVEHVKLEDLQEWFPKYLYLPRLTKPTVLEDAVRDGAGLLEVRDAFGIAEGFDEGKGRYMGLRVSEGVGVVYGQTLLVKPEVAQAAKQQVEPPAPDDDGDGVEPGPDPDAPSPEILPKTFAASVDLNYMRLSSQVRQISEEILQHLDPGQAGVSLSLEIRVDVSNGISPEVVRTVRENANALKFKHVEFGD
ncbi:MAG: AAA+ family ATPase [Planctomycetes bacterium]|nr:AAA+ family ATPase [Planctomycetota bacterium]